MTARVGVRLQSTRLQRCGTRSGPTCPCHSRPLQRAPRSGAQTATPATVHDVLRAAGEPLPDGVRRDSEARFGHDFAHVRIHTDRAAAASAEVVNARAYTVGNHIAFAAGHYDPGSRAGRELLTHELVHTIQQAGAPISAAATAEIEDPGSLAEQEARSLATTVGASDERPGRYVRPRQSAETAAVMRAGPDPATCTSRQRSIIEKARAAAAIESQIAYWRTTGFGPEPPPGRPSPGADWSRRSQRLARTIFGNDPDMAMVARTVERMRDRLSSPSLPVTCARAGDSACKLYTAYVVGKEPPIHLCPSFFTASEDERIDRLIHESAHLAGVGDPEHEAYCFTGCDDTCGDTNSADAWAKYVGCLAALRGPF